MNKLIRLIVLAFALSMPISIWGQCASIYQKGETYMKRGRYRDAIKSFKAAMKCDSNLEQACKNKIKRVWGKNKSRSQASASCRNHQTYHRQKKPGIWVWDKDCRKYKNRKSSRTMDCNIRCRLVSSDSRWEETLHKLPDQLADYRT